MKNLDLTVGCLFIVKVLFLKVLITIYTQKLIT